VRAKAKEAATLASRLRQLQSHPSDRDGAKKLAGAFKRAGSCS
jgi:hypothetical protein